MKLNINDQLLEVTNSIRQLDDLRQVLLNCRKDLKARINLCKNTEDLLTLNQRFKVILDYDNTELEPRNLALLSVLEDLIGAEMEKKNES